MEEVVRMEMAREAEEVGRLRKGPLYWQGMAYRAVGSPPLPRLLWWRKRWR